MTRILRGQRRGRHARTRTNCESLRRGTPWSYAPPHFLLAELYSKAMKTNNYSHAGCVRIVHRDVFRNLFKHRRHERQFCRQFEFRRLRNRTTGETHELSLNRGCSRGSPPVDRLGRCSKFASWTHAGEVRSCRTKNEQQPLIVAEAHSGTDNQIGQEARIAAR